MLKRSPARRTVTGLCGLHASVTLALATDQSQSLTHPPNDELFESDVAVRLGVGHFEIE